MTNWSEDLDYGEGKSRQQESDDSVFMLAGVLFGVGLWLAVIFTAIIVTVYW